MRPALRHTLTLTAGATALLLLAGCGADRPAAARHAGTAGQSANAVSVASSPAAGTSDPPVALSSPSSAVPLPTSATPTAAPVRTSSSAPATPPHTRQVVLRPVTAAGHVAAGFTLAPPRAGDGVDCGGTAPGVFPSAVAVDDGIAGCSPSAEYAVACWNGPGPNIALCFRDPWLRVVAELPDQGRLPVEKAPAVPSPLGLTLSDGSHCMLRDGGAWGTLDGHPELFGTYSCDSSSLVVWGGRNSDGIDRSHSLWTVRVAPGSGHGALRTVSVRTAYLVGTAAS